MNIHLGIPTTRISSLDFLEVELPVAKAVETLALAGEPTISSGFHEALNKRWTIVFKGIASPKATMAAEKAGLEVTYREAPRGTGQYWTDISLPDVELGEVEKATAAFNKFAELYEAEA